MLFKHAIFFFFEQIRQLNQKSNNGCPCHKVSQRQTRNRFSNLFILLQLYCAMITLLECILHVTRKTQVLSTFHAGLLLPLLCPSLLIGVFTSDTAIKMYAFLLHQWGSCGETETQETTSLSVASISPTSISPPTHSCPEMASRHIKIS